MKSSLVFMMIGAVVILLLVLTEIIGGIGAFGLVVFLALIAAIWSGSEKKKERQEATDRLAKNLDSIEGFASTKRLVGPWGFIAIDSKQRKVAIKSIHKPIQVHSYGDVIACEVVVDGNIIHRKSGALGRAVLGSILAGSAGAIVGGLSAKSFEENEVKNIDLKLVFRDTTNPSISIRFFDAWEETSNTKKSVKATDSVYGAILKKSLDELNNWKETFEIIIDQEDQASAVSAVKTGLSIADEIGKLSQLRADGVLSQEEFDSQKAKLLS